MDQFDVLDIDELKPRIEDFMKVEGYTQGYQKGVDDTLIYFSNLLKRLHDEDFHAFLRFRQGA
jgi:hypothetical protein